MTPTGEQIEKQKFKRASLHFILSAPEAPLPGERGNKVLELTEGLL